MSSSGLHDNRSTGQKMVESSWLDVHYQASRAEYEAMLNSAGIQSGWRVLDAGAGSGSYLPLLCQLVGEQGEVNALDLAVENVKAMQQRVREAAFGCPVHVFQGALLKLPFEDHCFDAVWCANTLQYFKVEMLPIIFQELKRVLKPGGLLAVKEFDDVGLHFGPFDPVLRWHLFEAVRGSELLFGAGALFPVDLRQHLLEAGFENVRFNSFTGDFQHPLQPVQIEFLHSALALYYDLAEQAGLPEEELAIWRQKLGDPFSDEYILNLPGFYFREVHGLALGTAP